MGTFIAMILKWLGGDVLGKVLGHLEKQAESDTERMRIQALREQALANTAAGVVTAGMSHRTFWIPWSMAAIPLAAWFGWGVLDTLFNGDLPDVATLPPQLKDYADTVWSNLFYSGAGVAGATSAASIIGRAIERRSPKTQIVVPNVVERS